MTATITDEQAADVIAAAFLTRLPARVRDQLLRDLSIGDRRQAYAAANRMPREMNALATETVDEFRIVPCGLGGWRIHHDETGSVLDIEGCWRSLRDLDLNADLDANGTTWSHRELAIAAANLTLSL